MRKIAGLLLLSLFTACLQAQEQPAPLPDKPEPQIRAVNAPPKRILGIVPAFDVIRRDDHVAPLSPSEKFRLFTNSSFDRFTLISAGLDAGINQATDTPHGYGQGGEGYARRYGAAIGDKVSSDFFKQFAFPTLFHQDPRYMQLGDKYSGSKRFTYAMSRTFIGRTDGGRNIFNFSEVMGTLASSGLTNIYYPEEDRDARTTFVRAGKRLALSMGLNVVKEFWPELRKVMRLPKAK